MLRFLTIGILSIVISITFDGCASQSVTSKESRFDYLLEKGKSEFRKPKKERDYFEAIKALEEAVLLNPENQEVHYFLGCGYWYRPDSLIHPVAHAQKVTWHFEKVIQIAPQYDGEIVITGPYDKITSVWASLAEIFITEGNIDSAKWAFQQGRRAGGFYPAIMENNKNMMASCDQNAILFTNGDNDTFPSWFLQIVEGYRTDITIVNLAQLNSAKYIRRFRDSRPEGERFISLNDNQIEGRETFGINPTTGDSLFLRVTPWMETNVNIPVLIESANSKSNISWKMKPTIKDSAIRVSDLMVLHIIEENNWRYPIYFASTVAPINKIGLKDYLEMEGLVFRLVNHKGRKINPKKMAENLFDVYTFGTVYDDHIANIPWIRRLFQNYRSAFMQLAVSYYVEYTELLKDPSLSDKAEEKRKQAVQVLNTMAETIPESEIAFPSKEWNRALGKLYKELGETEKLD